MKIEHAVENLVDGSFFNSGQSCCGIERIYVHEKVYAPFVEGFVDLTKKYVVGNPLDEATTIGPMARASFADTVRGQIGEALRKGAKKHVGMKHDKDRDGSPYLAPEVLTEVNHQMAVMREESFGPVVGIMKVKDDDEAVQPDERQPLRADRLRVDHRSRPRGTDRRPHRDRHRLRQPLRLSRPGAHLDRRQGYRPRRGALEVRLRRADQAEELSLERRQMTKLVANWSYPTAIRFGAGRIAELADACKAAGIVQPLLVTDSGLAKLEVTQRALEVMRKGGLTPGIFSNVRPNPVESNLTNGVSCLQGGRS